MCKKITFLLILSLLIISCSEDNSSGPSNENGSGSQGSEIPCNTSNEGMVIKPADSETERICKDGVWEVVLNSSSSVQVVESSSSEIINIPVPVNSSANENFSSIGEESSSSILSSGETTESSSSESGIIEQSSSSSEEIVESSSSEETKLYLCEDGETYVLDLANCEKVSSSSVIVVSSSSDNKQISSSSDIQESSSSEMSSSSVNQESSSSKVESSSSINSSSSSVKIEESSSSKEASSSSVIMSEISSSDVANSSSEIASSSSLGCIYGNGLYDKRDGKNYKTVIVGEQEWMAENLNYLPDDTVGTFFGGHSVCGGGEYKSLKEGDCSVFGRLYDVKITSSDGNNKNICPDGWSVPNANQWNVLIEFLDENQAGERMKLNDKTYWPNSEVVNESGFSAIPSGYYSPYSGFNKLDPVSPAVFTISSSVINVNAVQIVDGTKGVIRKTYGHGFFIAIRCIKD
jgi:uncharacterized protein (TIGR02145 family)